MSGFRWFGRSVGYWLASGAVRERSRLDRQDRHHQQERQEWSDRSPQMPRSAIPTASETPRTAPLRGEEERLAASMDRFCYVRSDYARQWRRADPAAPGGWSYGWARVGKSQPADCALTPTVVRAHLQGRITVGIYLLDAQDRCRMLVLDHDDKRTLAELDPATGQPRVIAEDGLVLLQDCRARFAQQGHDAALLESRRGGHLFVFFDEPVAARDARALALLGLGAEEVWHIQEGEQAFEIYPKQDRRGDRESAVGSNIALPLGVHLKDGQRHPFVDEYGHPVALTLSGQLDYLETLRRVPVRQVLRDRPWLYDELERAMQPARPRSAERPAERPSEPTLAPPGVLDMRSWSTPSAPAAGSRPSLIAQWKAAVDCRDIVRAYGVELTAHGVGRCPFHDDQHASFQAWCDAWRCYAEDRGGDALQFVMEQERMSAREALAFVRAHFPVPGLELSGPDQPRRPRGRG